MTTPKNFFNSKTASAAGKKSKRRSYDAMIADKLDEHVRKAVAKGDTRTRLDLMIEAADREFLDGNPRPWAYLNDRGYGKAKENKTVEGDVVIKVTREIIDKTD